jgi:demethoxyubiquinone hydroxylase (CLK1/Coq7/Cat5 family)
MTNNKLLLPLAVTASFAFGAVSYHLGADKVKYLFQDESEQVKLEKQVDEKNINITKLETKIGNKPQLEPKAPANVATLVSQLETVSNAYFSKEQQIERVYEKTLQTLDNFSSEQLSNLEKQVAYRVAVPMSSESLARKRYDNVVSSLNEFSQEALSGLNKEIVRRFSQATYNSVIGKECLTICREKLDGGFGSTYSTK